MDLVYKTTMLTQGGRGGVAEIADFVWLQTANRYLPLFNHFLLTRPLHPLRFFDLQEPHRKPT